MDNKVIGGFFELELNDFGSVFHDDASAVNSGRNALKFILENASFRKVYLPFYTCEVVLEPLATLSIEYEFYHIDKALTPINIELKDHEGVIINNYFGVLDDFIHQFVQKYGDAVIVDNAQAFYCKCPKGVKSFYSPRKFFGVPDGGFAYPALTDSWNQFHQGSSLFHFRHLIARIDIGAQEAYADYKKSEAMLGTIPLERMSRLTRRLLSNVDFLEVKRRRILNFRFIHSRLRHVNELTPILDSMRFECPMVYPFLRKRNYQLRAFLIENDVFTATYWAGVHKAISNSSAFECRLERDLLALPIDQRFDLEDMKRILFLIEGFHERRIEDWEA